MEEWRRSAGQFGAHKEGEGATAEGEEGGEEAAEEEGGGGSDEEQIGWREESDVDKSRLKERLEQDDRVCFEMFKRFESRLRSKSERAKSSNGVERTVINYD
jgi:hypothetical protein